MPTGAALEEQVLFNAAEQVQTEINRQQQILHHQQQQLMHQQHQQVQQQIHLHQMQHQLNNSIAAGVMPIQIASGTDTGICQPVPMAAVPMAVTVPIQMPINTGSYALPNVQGQPEQQPPQQQVTGSEFGTTQQSTPDNTVMPGDAQLSAGSQNQAAMDKTATEA